MGTLVEGCQLKWFVLGGEDLVHDLLPGALADQGIGVLEVDACQTDIHGRPFRLRSLRLIARRILVVIGCCLPRRSRCVEVPILLPRVRRQEFMRRILQRGHRFLKHFHQRIAPARSPFQGREQVRETSYEHPAQSRRSIRG